MNDFNDGLENLDEDGLKNLRKEFKKEFEEMKDGLKELDKNIDELNDLGKGIIESNENLDDLVKSFEGLNILDNEFQEYGAIEEDTENIEVSEYLQDRFFLVGVDNYNAFDKLILNEIPDYEENYSVLGFSLYELEAYNKKFKEYGVTALFMQYKLMIKAAENANDERLFSFEPIEGEERKGVLIPKYKDLNKKKPARDYEIDEIDVHILGSRLEAFNNGEISFEEFLGSI